MKPSLQFIDTNHRRDVDGSRGQRSALPMTDYNFQSSGYSNFSRDWSEDNVEPSFRSISEDYFNRDARSTFAGEAILFAVLVLIVAVPVLQGVRGLLQFVHVVGVL